MSMKSTYGNFEKSYTRKIKIKSALVFTFCLILTFITLIPIWLLIVNATRSDFQITTTFSLIPSNHFFSNLKTLFDWSSVDMLLGFKNSAIITFSASILSIFFSCMTAYGLVVYDFKLRGPAFTFILAVMMVPMQVSAVGFMKFMIDIGLYNTFVPLIVPAMAAPPTVFYIRQYMKSAFPLEIVEAARIDGSSEFRTFVTIGLPLMKPAIAVQAIFTFIAQWNNYFMPSVMIVSPDKRTLPMMIKSLSSDPLIVDYGAIYTGLAVSILPLVIVYLIISRFIIQGVALGGVKE